MMKTIFYLLLLIFLGVASVNAQVTIGSEDEPHPGAVLDLHSSDKGLRLPGVYLLDADVFQLSSTDASNAIGMIVYNTNPNMAKGYGKGIYVWDGSKWMLISMIKGIAFPVTSIGIYSTSDLVQSGSIVDIWATVLPDTAKQEVAWSVIPKGSNPGSGFISSTGPLKGWFTGVAAGLVEIRATATDGSNISNTKEITVTVATVPTVPVSKIDITGPASLKTPGRAQLKAVVSPSNATNKDVIWLIISGDPKVMVDQNGLVTANGVVTGTATIRATSADDNSIYGEFTLSLEALMKEETTIQGNNGSYKVYCYEPSTGLGCWMIENSKEGITSKICYTDGENPNYTIGQRGYYYKWDMAVESNGTAICPPGFVLPSRNQWADLMAYINGRATDSEKDHWRNATSKAGYFAYNPSGNGWYYWGVKGHWWVYGDGEGRTVTLLDDKNGIFTGFKENKCNGRDKCYWFSVRCVMQ
jgi:uncharacterized protein (TIGR02145 family)